MKNTIHSLLTLSFFLLAVLQTSGKGESATITGELKKWHTVTLTFDGPMCSETDEYNPFFNYRLNVTFTHQKSGKSYKIPGYFAADGNAGMSSASSGNKWRVHFTPDEMGSWEYAVDFKKGKWVAVRDRTKKVPSGEFMDGENGSFSIQASDKSGRDFRAHGRLQYVGERYLRLAETGKYFYKCGSDAPENFLAYKGFDGDFATDGHKDDLVKTWAPHLKDWKEGDPQWSDGRGKEIIGALNYLASKDLNAFSFLTNNIGGDDRNVFPYINYDTWDRFDCSKLDQWEMVFDHAQKIGLFLHFKTLEAENQGLLDFGGIGAYTKLYYRELIARFGHHLALNWNLCEEIGDWKGFDGQETIPLYAVERRALAQYIYDTDPYHHHMVIHNGEWYDPMYGDQSKLTGASLQTNKTDFSQVNSWVKKVLDEAKAAGKVWAVACDEPGDASHSLIPDAEDPEHFDARTNGLWGTMLAGGWGTEWYFGYQHAHSDLTCQDYRSRDLFWDMGAICINFFAVNNFPLNDMSSKNELVSSEGDFCFAKEGNTYIILLKKGGKHQLNLKEHGGTYTVKWFDPRNGGNLQNGSVKKISGKGMTALGSAPNNPEKDWIVVVRADEGHSSTPQGQWKTIQPQGTCTARHENGFVAHADDLYLIGGRGVKPVEKYSPQTNSWTTLKSTPIEIHHFTPVSVHGKIYVVGGFSGRYPKELPLSHVYAYDATSDIWEKVLEIPEARRRGGAGVTVYNGKIYIVNGITYGHTSGTCAMFDVFDPVKNTWNILPDAPHIRDHSGAAIVDDKLISIGGRNTSYHEEGNFTAFFRTVISEIDYYDFKTGQWSTYKSSVPAPSAGAGVVELNGKVYFIGGETNEKLAYNQVHAFNPADQSWEQKPFLERGRHGTNAVVNKGAIYIAAGSGNRGGSPELNSIEVFMEPKQ